MTDYYQKLDTQKIETIKHIAGEKNVLTAPEDLERYSRDEMPDSRSHLPEAVVLAQNTQTVAEILRFASKHHIPVTPRGSGTGLSGGCVPVCGGILLSLEKMNRIVEIDEANQVAVVEPGVTLGDLQQAAEAVGLYYPVYPGEKGATLGGNVATNAGGMRAVKYGVTRHFVLGVEAVLASGQVLKLGGKFVKCTSGYDLAQLLIGSEGTLAVITQATLRLGIPPKSREVLFIPFPSLEKGIGAVPDILKCPITPTGLEFMERDIVEIVEKHTGREMPFHEHRAFLMVILEGSSQEELLEASRQIEAAVRAHDAVDIFVPPSEKARKDLLEMREKFYPAIKLLGKLELVDAVVPRSLIPRFLKQVKSLGKQYGIEVIAYGHAGDGNVHLHPLCGDLAAEDWRSRLPAIMTDIYREALQLGGAISGEHGIGFDKLSYFENLTDRALLEAMKNIKLALDPNNILNPGKLFTR